MLHIEEAFPHFDKCFQLLQGAHSVHVLSGARPNGGLMNYGDIPSAASTVVPGEGALHHVTLEQPPGAG